MQEIAEVLAVYGSTVEDGWGGWMFETNEDGVKVICRTKQLYQSEAAAFAGAMSLRELILSLGYAPRYQQEIGVTLVHEREDPVGWRGTLDIGLRRIGLRKV